MSITSKFEKQGYLIADGATGTELIKYGVLKKGISPESLYLSNPGVYTKIHRSYYEAGSDLVVSNTFGGTRTKLEEWGLENKIEEINTVAVQCVKKALKSSGKEAYVAASIGPCGRLLAPLGGSSMEEIISIFHEQFKIICNEGVDIIMFETFSDLRELKAAYIALRDISNVPAGVSLTFDDNGRTLLNNTPESMAVTFNDLDVLFIGSNCSVGPDDMNGVLQRMGEYTVKPLLVQANAGIEGRGTFSVNDFSKNLDSWISSGARVFGGCCGSGPELIRMYAEVLPGKKIEKKIEYKKGLHLSSASKVISAGNDYPTLVIGERINPTNKKDMIAELEQGKLNIVKEFARKQITEGADLLDVNLGAPGVDQSVLMKKTFEMLSSNFDIPLVIDSSDINAIESALRTYGGKALINSTTADTERANAILDLAKKYGAAVIGLCMDESGIPLKSEERVKFALKIKELATGKKIENDNLVIDTLTLALSSNQNEALETIKAIRTVKNELGLSTVLGVSNISFGLPARANLNQIFLSLAVNEGLDFAIINPSSEKLMIALDVMKVIQSHDIHSIEYINKYANQSKASVKEKIESITDPVQQLNQSIIDGNDSVAVEAAVACLKKGMSMPDIASKAMIPGIEIVGRYFKEGKYFLPQVVLSAQAMKKAFSVLKKNSGNEKLSNNGKVLMATVKGDIHDIGKNIVKTLFETNGFEVVDLGKSVDAKTIVARAKELSPDMIGLSALMTTTMEEMGIVIQELKKNSMNIPVMVGGAVVTQEFADKIGAALFAKDAMQAVDKLKDYLSKQ